MLCQVLIPLVKVATAKSYQDRLILNPRDRPQEIEDQCSYLNTTHCFNNRESVKYLLDMKEVSISPKSINRNYAYVYDLTGLDQRGRETEIQHSMILLYSSTDESWLIFDSYYDCRRVDFTDLHSNISALHKQFDPLVWENVTLCYEEDKGLTRRVNIRQIEYTYDLDQDQIERRYLELLQKQPG